MEVIRDKVCEGRVLRERVQELRGQVLDLGNEKEALSREVHDLRAKNADLVVERANVSALVAGLEISKTAADRRIAELEGLLESCKKSKELAEGRLEEQNSIMEGLRLEIEKGCLLNGELKSVVKSLEGGSATARNLGLSAAQQMRAFSGPLEESPGSFLRIRMFLIL
jgi:chromosome segregation ATPase